MKKALITGVLLLLALFVGAYTVKGQKSDASAAPSSPSDIAIDSNAQHMLARGKQTFRFDTFGDQSFWGQALQLHQAIEGSKLGGVGPGVSPRTALAVGLKD
jgi:hypothetical protein